MQRLQSLYFTVIARGFAYREERTRLEIGTIWEQEFPAKFAKMK
jgi:hypothetical protein